MCDALELLATGVQTPLGSKPQADVVWYSGGIGLAHSV